MILQSFYCIEFHILCALLNPSELCATYAKIPKLSLNEPSFLKKPKNNTVNKGLIHVFYPESYSIISYSNTHEKENTQFFIGITIFSLSITALPMPQIVLH